MLNESRINANYLKFINYLEKYKCYSEEMINELGDKIKFAPYSTQLSFGGAEPGGLIDVTLNVLCRIAAEINNKVFGYDGGDRVLHPYLSVNNEMLMRVLLLLNIAKADTFVENKSEWHKKNLGKVYEYYDHPTKMKLGQRGLYLCQKYGIKLEEEEFEAFLAIDSDECTGERFQTPLYTMVRAAKMFTLVELKQRSIQPKQENTVEK